VLAAFGLESREISTQTYPRKLDYLLLSALAGLGASLSKFAADVRILSSPEFGEVAEPFGSRKSAARRCRSNAIPFFASASTRWRGCWSAIATSRGRTRDELSRAHARRQRQPPHDPSEALLCADELIVLARKVVEGLRVDERRIELNCGRTVRSRAPKP